MLCAVMLIDVSISVSIGNHFILVIYRGTEVLCRLLENIDQISYDQYVNTCEKASVGFCTCVAISCGAKKS